MLNGGIAAIFIFMGRFWLGFIVQPTFTNCRFDSSKDLCHNI